MPACPEIVIHDLEQARAVLETAAALGRKVQLRSAVDASAYAGVGYLHALGEAAGHELLVDCHDDAGLVMAALRAGCRKLVFSGKAETHRRLADIAAQLGGSVRHETAPPVPRLVLSPEDDGIEATRAWLATLP